jgi:hypothetical protein
MSKLSHDDMMRAMEKEKEKEKEKERGEESFLIPITP